MEVFRDLPGSSELSAFCKQDASNRVFSDELRHILEVSAMTGLYWHNWDELKTLLSFRLKQVLQDYHKNHVDVAVGPPRPLVTGETYQELEDRLSSGLDSFTDGAPFTLQRLCEVLLNPRDRYPNLDKVALAFEKLLLVTSTFTPSSGPYPGIVLAPVKEADKNLVEVPKVDNVDVSQEIKSELSVLPVQTDQREGQAASVTGDEEMVDVESIDTKEPSMDIDVPQPLETTAAGEGPMESKSEMSAGNEEWQPAEANNPAAPSPETSSQSAVMVDSTESKGDDVPSSIQGT